jgi:hypothetical protein
MKRQYSSFLIRCWLLDGGQQRIKIEHIQSGEAIQVASPVAAMDWMNARWSELFSAKVGDQCQPECKDGQDALPENL